ncbi:hypothetical protein ACU8KH_01676 [Lachancea thermotolerans]
MRISLVLLCSPPWSLELQHAGIAGSTGRILTLVCLIHVPFREMLSVVGYPKYCKTERHTSLKIFKWIISEGCEQRVKVNKTEFVTRRGRL